MVSRAQDLENDFIKCKKDGDRLDSELESRRERFLKREVEYRKIIEDL